MALVHQIPNEDYQILMASRQNCNIFFKYYFDIELLPHQVLTCHAMQSSILTLGGRGSGKTFGYAMRYIWLSTLMPDLRVLWTSYTGNQAAIAFYEVIKPLLGQSERFRKFLPEGLSSLKKKPYPAVYIKWPGSNLPESYITFMPSDASGSGDTKRGFTWDCIHIDEGGLIMDPRVISTLRPSMRGRRNVPGRPPRMGQMTVSTTPTHSPWLREWWENANNPEYPTYDPKKFYAIRVSSHENTTLTKEQLEMFWADMSEEERRVEIEAGFPEYMGNEFSPTIVNACEDKQLNLDLEQMIQDAVPGAELREAGKPGIVLYQKPMNRNRKYVLCGDPGTGNPPERNAGCILVWDVTETPYELVYFNWVFGNGEYRPFFNAFEWCYRYYEPVYACFDATGTQRAMDELYFEDRGIIVEGLSVTTEKPAMVNTLKIMLQKKLLRFPHLRGMRLQLLNYRLDEDRKLAQDIVMAMAMSVWKMRLFFYRNAQEVGRGEKYQIDKLTRNGLRDHKRYSGRR